MESNYQGDLADIFRPGSVNSGDPPGISDWQYFDHQSDQETQMIQKSTRNQDIDHQGFGQPFTSLLADPLIHEVGISSTPCFFGTTSLNENHKQLSAAARIPLGFDDNIHNNINQNNHDHNIFSKMLQISSNAANSETITANSSSSKRSLLEASSTTSLQISSPRNPAIKRRKSQAKRVVHVPAPTPVNSRSTGEVVPSDLWAWRKYGQKPIKGSPYPRGYYRCSSSKGCSARKQVERSRTDPNLLVITYTSEHNHPWPTQRNALAGSTRAHQPSKTATEPTPKKETTEDEGSRLLGGGVQVKDELQVLEGSFPQDYRPELPDHGGGGGQPDDFFSGLGEIEVDPISMLLNHGFLGGGEDDEEAQNYSKDLDPFG